MPPPSASRFSLWAWAGAAYFYGLAFGYLGLCFHSLFGFSEPVLDWWQWLLAPLVVGSIVLTLKAICLAVARALGEHSAGQPEWKHKLAVGWILFFIAMIIFGPVIFRFMIR